MAVTWVRMDIVTCRTQHSSLRSQDTWTSHRTMRTPWRLLSTRAVRFRSLSMLRRNLSPSTRTECSMRKPAATSWRNSITLCWVWIWKSFLLSELWILVLQQLSVMVPWKVNSTGLSRTPGGLLERIFLAHKQSDKISVPTAHTGATTATFSCRRETTTAAWWPMPLT